MAKSIIFFLSEMTSASAALVDNSADDLLWETEPIVVFTSKHELINELQNGSITAGAAPFRNKFEVKNAKNTITSYLRARRELEPRMTIVSQAATGMFAYWILRIGPATVAKDYGAILLQYERSDAGTVDSGDNGDAGTARAQILLPS